MLPRCGGCQLLALATHTLQIVTTSEVHDPLFRSRVDDDLDQAVAAPASPPAGGHRLSVEPLSAGLARQMVRVLSLVVVTSVGTALLALVTCVPGYRRERRGAWALQHSARWMVRALGVRVVVEGVARSGPALVAANNASLLDTLVLTGCAPMLLIANAPFREWPLFGRAAVRSGTIFIDNSFTGLPRTVEDITAALRSGFLVQAFPQGVPCCGPATGGYRRAAFRAAIDAAVIVVPVSLSSTDHLYAAARQYAFSSGAAAAELRRILAVRHTTVTVRWLAPIPAIAGTGCNAIDRATLAMLTHRAIKNSLALPVEG